MSIRELYSTDFIPESKLTFPCKICGDKSSGVHYGVISCEGCKGFYRRTIRQNMKYPACVFVGNCRLTRETRTRCQECRFKKCIYVGMSKDCIRYGRIPKKEKTKIIAERIATMHSSPTRSNENLYSEHGGNFLMSGSLKYKTRRDSDHLAEKYFRMAPIEPRRHSEKGSPQRKMVSYLYENFQHNGSGALPQTDKLNIGSGLLCSTVMPQRVSPIRFTPAVKAMHPVMRQIPLICTSTVPLAATTLPYNYSRLLLNRFLNAYGDNMLRAVCNQAM